VGDFKSIAADAGAATKKPAASRTPKETAPREVVSPTQRRGRPKGSGKQGKRSAKDRKLAGAYVRKTTHREVMKALIDEPRDFSDLVEDLLSEWLQSRK
jgi:hypothetical protein